MNNDWRESTLKASKEMVREQLEYMSHLRWWAKPLGLPYLLAALVALGIDYLVEACFKKS